MKRGNLVRTVQVRVDNATAEKIRKRAQADDVRESQVVRRALRQYLEATP